MLLLWTLNSNWCSDWKSRAFIPSVGGYFYISPKMTLEFFPSMDIYSDNYINIVIWIYIYGGYFYISLKMTSEFFPSPDIYLDNYINIVIQIYIWGYLYISPKMTLEFFPNCGGYQNMKTSECHEKSKYAKMFDLWAFFVDHFGPQSSGWTNFGSHFDPLAAIAQGLNFYWSFTFCPSLPVSNLVQKSWML